MPVCCQKISSDEQHGRPNAKPARTNDVDRRNKNVWRSTPVADQFNPHYDARTNKIKLKYNKFRFESMLQPH